MSIPQALVDTTFSGKDISSAVSVYEYTAPSALTIRIQVRLAAVAGDGDYIAHLTLNDGDAQTDDPIGPRTTYTAASGETAFWFATISLDVLAGDVVNVMLKGQAGDTSESGSIRIFTDSLSDVTLADDAITAAKIAAGAIGTSEAPLLANLDAAISTVSTGVLTGIVEGTITIQQALRLALAVLTGKSSGGGTATHVYRDTGDSVNRITATVDANGNRTSVTRDVT